MKKYLTFFIVFIFVFVIRVNAESYETGDLIKYKNIKFYVVEDKGEYLTLLKATPLTLEEVKAYSEYTTTGIGASYYLGYLPYCKNLDKENSQCTYEDSNVKAALDKWSKENLNLNDLVEDSVYLNGIKEKDELYNKKYKVRLLTGYELIHNFKYGTSSSSSNSYYDDCKYYHYNYKASAKTPLWANPYEHYFLMDYLKDFNEYDENCKPEEYYYSSNFSEAYISTLRPVINLSKSADINKIKSKVKKINEGEFKIGDIVRYNGVEYYVLKNSSKSDETVTMVKRLPLTEKEIKKTGYDSKMMGTGYDIYDEDEDATYTMGRVRYYYNEDNKCYYYYDNNESKTKFITDGCTTDYKASDIKKIVDVWADEYVEKEDLAVDSYGYKVRIISVDDLVDNLGYVSANKQTSGITVNYFQQTEDSIIPFQICWTMSQFDDSNYKVGQLDRLSNIENDAVYNSSGAVCPVITINKQKAIQSLEKSKVTIPDTLLSKPVFIVVVGIILIVVSTIVISLILKKRHKIIIPLKFTLNKKSIEIC